jgi:sec-independent protein translocase protein TatA
MLLSVLLGMLGGQEIIIIALILLLLFGGKKIPELMRGMGKGIKEFKDASKGTDAKPEEEKKA